MKTFLAFAILSAVLVGVMLVVMHAALCVVNDFNAWRDRRRWMKEWRSQPNTMRTLNPPKHIRANIYKADSNGRSNRSGRHPARVVK